MADFSQRDGAYLVLLGVAAGHRLTVHDDKVVIADPVNAGQFLPVGEADLDNLEAAGLIATTGEGTDAGPVITEKGEYWLRRWVTAKFKVKRFAIHEVRMSRIR